MLKEISLMHAYQKQKELLEDENNFLKDFCKTIYIENKALENQKVKEDLNNIQNITKTGRGLYNLFTILSVLTFITIVGPIVFLNLQKSIYIKRAKNELLKYINEHKEYDPNRFLIRIDIIKIKTTSSNQNKTEWARAKKFNEIDDYVEFNANYRFYESSLSGKDPVEYVINHPTFSKEYDSKRAEYRNNAYKLISAKDDEILNNIKNLLGDTLMQSREFLDILTKESDSHKNLNFIELIKYICDTIANSDPNILINKISKMDNFDNIVASTQDFLNTQSVGIN